MDKNFFGAVSAGKSVPTPSTTLSEKTLRQMLAVCLAFACNGPPKGYPQTPKKWKAGRLEHHAQAG
jgi:hypothetical protein